MLPFGVAKSPECLINRAFIEVMELFPTRRCGGFGGYIVNYAIYVFYLVCDTI